MDVVQELGSVRPIVLMRISLLAPDRRDQLGVTLTPIFKIAIVTNLTLGWGKDRWKP